MSRRDWLFTGGALSIDFVNTLRERWSPSPRETVDDDVELAEWMRSAGLVLRAGTDESSAHTEAMRLREALEALFERRAAPDQLERITARAGEAPRRGVIGSADDVWARFVPELTVWRTLGLIAEDAVRIVAEGRLDRVSVCQHERCALLFLDTSRGGRRQWCSMQRCGNRMKAARFEQRRRHPIPEERA